MGIKISEQFKKCPRCGYTEEIDISVVSVANEFGGTRVKWVAKCPECDLQMSRDFAVDLKDAWNVSKKRRVEHVKESLNMPNVKYTGGSAFIGQDTVNVWGDLEELRKYLKHKTGRQHIDFERPEDGIGLVVYSNDIKKKRGIM